MSSSEIGSSKLFHYLLMLVTGIALAAVGSWASSVNHATDTLESRMIIQEKLSIEINTKLNILLQQRQPNVKATIQELP